MPEKNAGKPVLIICLMQKMSDIFLCDTDELNVISTREIEVTLVCGESVQLFVVCVSAGEFHAYKNRCPHKGVTLNWLPNQFLSIDQQEIQCATHNARFDIKTGVCLSGPCVGQSLSKLILKIRDNKIFWQSDQVINY